MATVVGYLSLSCFWYVVVAAVESAAEIITTTAADATQVAADAIQVVDATLAADAVAKNAAVTQLAVNYHLNV